MSRAPAAHPSLSSRVSRSFEVGCTTLIAWAFGAATAGVLGYLAYNLWNGSFKFASPLSIAPASMSNNLEQAKPWGLSFSGQAAPILAVAEAMGVVLALVMSMMFASTPRRLGLVLMIFWSGLWAADAVMILAGSWDHGWWHAPIQFIAATAALFIIVAAMVHRAARMWRIPVSI
jgi:hypothetical protein